MAAGVRRHADAVVDARTDLVRLRRVPLLGPADLVADGGDAVADARVREGRLGVGVPDLVQVHQPEGDGVHADRVGRLLHGDLERERPVRVRHAPVGPRLEAVGEDIDRFELQVRDLVEVLHVEPRAVRGAGALRADVRDDLELAEREGPVLVHAELHLVAELVAVRPRDEILVARVVHLDRAGREL